jgi:hypothetical protein
MIDWRVRKAFEDERVVILDTNKTVIEISTLLSDRIVALEASILQLRRDLDALEQRQQ